VHFIINGTLFFFRLILHYHATKGSDYGVSRQPPEYKHAEYYV